MKVVHLVSLALPLALVSAGCEHKQATVSGLEAPRAPEVLEAHWVTGPELTRAVSEASGKPIVKRVIAETVDPRLTPMWQLAVKAEGRLLDGRRVGVTILPYMVDQDPTHARFISYIDDSQTPYAEPSDLIVGREPTSLETGYAPVDLGGRIGYVKCGAPYKLAASGAILRGSERLNWSKFIQCFFDTAPSYCASGSGLADAIAPNVPYAKAIGCGVGTALAALGCAVQGNS
jgi:hypothetical protein